MAVRFQATLSSGCSACRPSHRARAASRAKRSSGPALSALGHSRRADVARAMHPRLRRHPRGPVLTVPRVLLAGEHVGLDAERRQGLRKLQRAVEPRTGTGG